MTDTPEWELTDISTGYTGRGDQAGRKELLKDGWEPFAVSEGRIWFRRPKKPVDDDPVFFAPGPAKPTCPFVGGECICLDDGEIARCGRYNVVFPPPPRFRVLGDPQNPWIKVRAGRPASGAK